MRSVQPKLRSVSAPAFASAEAQPVGVVLTWACQLHLPLWIARNQAAEASVGSQGVSTDYP